MKEVSFVNEAFQKAIQDYIHSSKKQDGILYHSFFVVVIRILVLIYGKLDILNPFYLDNSVAFFNNLAKYGMNKSDLALFKEEFLNYYQFEQTNKKRKIRIPNPYFKSTLRYLIDMFVAKKKNSEVGYLEEEEFLDLIYTDHTKNPYRISDRYFMLDDVMYAEKYYYSRLNEFDVTKEVNLDQTLRMNLNLEAFQAMGIGLSNLSRMSSSEILKAKEEAYQYFEVDADSVNREEELKEKLQQYKMHGRPVTTGNGYVDILLLMSVIITSLSVLAIIIFHII